MPDLELLPPKQKKECPCCHKLYSKLFKCKDGIKRCGNCKRKTPTNKFYDPLWKEKQQFVGKYSMSNQESYLLIKSKMKQGISLESAKKQVEIDKNQISKLRPKKYKNILNKNWGNSSTNELPKANNLKVEENAKSSLNEEFIQSLGQDKVKDTN